MGCPLISNPVTMVYLLREDLVQPVPCRIKRYVTCQGNGK